MGDSPTIPPICFSPVTDTPQHATIRWGLSSLDGHHHSACFGRLIPQTGVSPIWSHNFMHNMIALTFDGTRNDWRPNPGELHFHWSKPKLLHPPQLLLPADIMQHDIRVHNENCEKLELGCQTFILLSSMRVLCGIKNKMNLPCWHPNHAPT